MMHRTLDRLMGFSVCSEFAHENLEYNISYNIKELFVYEYRTHDKVAQPVGHTV